jgi:UMF1 family MFS transporter
MTTAAAGDYAPSRRKTGAAGLTGWVMFDWATQPFYTLIGTFLFAPYFTAHFVGDARGASWWGYATAASALIIAIASPLIGAMADARGRVKPYMAAFGAAFIVAQALLWFAEPGALDRLWLIVGALIVATCCAEFMTMLNNSLMPRLVPPEQLGRLSGTGWAVGYAGGLVSLLLMAAFVLIDEKTGRTVLGLEPLIANDASRPADRLVAPFCALWFAIFVLPFFLFTPDARKDMGEEKTSFRDALGSLGETIRNVRRYRNIALFLVAYLLFIDGLMAIFSFGGIYAVTVFGWQSLTLASFGLILAVAGGLGAFLGGFLDDRLGSKTVIVGALVMLMIACLGVISIDATHILFAVEVPAPEPGRSLFESTGEVAYIAFALLIGLASGPLQSASRSLLARMAPPEHISEFYGLFAFSGKVSAFAAPMTIGLVNSLTGSLRLGMATILLFLGVGLAVMLTVRTERAAGKPD